jgi:AcrR family transcriptional regulator
MVTKSRTNNPQAAQADILNVATREFAEKGLAGARIDLIAQATHTSKRMIYYYYSNKETLYLAVIEESYRRMRAIEHRLNLDDLDPISALKKLVAFTVDYQYANPDFVRLVMAENMQRGQFLAKSKAIQQLNVPAIDRLKQIYTRGVASGQFRTGLDPVDLHMSISALSVFNIANRHTFGLIFKRDFDSPRWLKNRRESIVEQIIRFVAVP